MTPAITPELRERAGVTVPCPACNGDGFLSFADRHTETRMDACPTCRGHGSIPARTGETPESSAPLACPQPTDGGSA